MIVGRKRALPDDEAEALYQDYCRWVEARELYSPSVLAKKYGVDRTTVESYGKRRQKSLQRRAA